MFATAAFSALGGGNLFAAARARRLNILYMMSDDHAAHAIGAYGSRINKTPHMDEMARSGMTLSNCFCTNPICTSPRRSWRSPTRQGPSRCKVRVSLQTLRERPLAAGARIATGMRKSTARHPPDVPLRCGLLFLTQSRRAAEIGKSRLPWGLSPRGWLANPRTWEATD